LARGAPFSSGRRRRGAVEGRSRDDLQRDLDTTRRRLVDPDVQTPDGDASTRLRVAEARAVAAEANAADAATQAAAAVAREARSERLACVYERASLRNSRDFPTNATPAITQNRRQRWPDDKPATAAAASTTSCACGCPSSGVDFDRLKREVQCAEALHLVKGKRACPTCHDCLEVIFELARDEPTGVCKKVITMLEFVRVKEAAQVRFDVDAENRRVRSVIAECELAKQAACATTAEVEEEDSDESSSDDGSSLSDDSHMLDLS
jgi:hypothetical protein